MKNRTKITAVLAASAVAVLVAPGAARADIQDGRITVPVSGRTAVVPDWQRAGNCTAFPEMTITVTDYPSGDYVVAVAGTVFTSRVHGAADVWHENISLRNSDGLEFAHLTLDGPQMRSPYQDQAFLASRAVHIYDVDAISQAVLSASC
ncbi:hypothetical protein [Cryptosporangium sp. NPDC051539]|uniref:hypothetical protein n=1 Tax=Cryptosporangium sp. NPDC051539 TaxID=3363962 RepID=UPI0037A117A3